MCLKFPILSTISTECVRHVLQEQNFLFPPNEPLCLRKELTSIILQEIIEIFCKIMICKNEKTFIVWTSNTFARTMLIISKHLGGKCVLVVKNCFNCPWVPFFCWQYGTWIFLNIYMKGNKPHFVLGSLRERTASPVRRKVHRRSLISEENSSGAVQMHHLICEKRVNDFMTKNDSITTCKKAYCIFNKKKIIVRERLWVCAMDL